MPTVLTALENYLRAQRESHPAPDLIDRILAQCSGLEFQVNVALDDNERIGKRFSTAWYQYGNFRIPWNAYSDPKWDDTKPQWWPLDVHAEAIGSTGWNWRRRTSEWVGFDFDSIVGHKSGISDTELDQVRQAAFALPYVEVRRSS